MLKRLFFFIFVRCCVDGVLMTATLHAIEPTRGALAARVSIFAAALRFAVLESVPTVSREVHGVRFLGGECSNI